MSLPDVIDAAPKIPVLLSDERDVIRVKEPSLETCPPGENLRFSIQVPVWNEMPERSWQFREIPNLALNVRSVVNAVMELEKNKHSPSEVEVLYNVNNGSGAASDSNARALQFIRSFGDTRPVEEVVDSFAWVPTGVDIAQFEGAEAHRMKALRKFYVSVLTDIRRLWGQGFRMYAIDCTDGTFIGKDPTGNKAESPTQGGRRRLMTEISVRRFDRVNNKLFGFRQEDSQLIIPLDCDSLMSRQALVDLSGEIEHKKGKSVLLMPYRFVRDAGWYRARIAEHRDETGRPIMETFTVDDRDRMATALFDSDDSDLTTVADFFRKQGLSDVQIRFLADLHPEEYAGFSDNLQGSTTVREQIRNVLHLMETNLLHEMTSLHKRDDLAVRDLEEALTNLFHKRDLHTGLKPHTFGISGSYAFTVSAYKACGGWEISNNSGETMQLLRRLDAAHAKFYPTYIHKATVKDRKRSGSFFGSNRMNERDPYQISSFVDYVKTMRGVYKYGKQTVESWSGIFVRNLRDLLPPDITEEEKELLQPLYRKSPVPESIDRLQYITHIIHLIDLQPGRYPNVSKAVRSMF